MGDDYLSSRMAGTVSGGAHAPGASLRALMARMGHDVPRGVMIYEHATTVEDRAIAGQLSGLVDAHRAGSDETTTQTVDADDDDDDGDDGSAGATAS
ncbi:MAG: hypothetical protein JO364_07425 [Pseudonocardiales bacterium]|nr:hypothetical protein [Pseudonocardiales bacterium]MBV9030130.1 hypothetical protein [Pseudonocardiales bacterium]